MYNTTGTEQQLIQPVPSNVSSSLDNLGNQFLIQDLTRNWEMYIKSSSDSSKPRIGLLENGNEGRIRYFFRNGNVQIGIGDQATENSEFSNRPQEWYFDESRTSIQIIPITSTIGISCFRRDEYLYVKVQFGDIWKLYRFSNIDNSYDNIYMELQSTPNTTVRPLVFNQAFLETNSIQTTNQ
jgi:hypothetical protein